MALLTELVRAALLAAALARAVALLRAVLSKELGACEGGAVREGRYREAEVTRTALWGVTTKTVALLQKLLTREAALSGVAL